MNELFAKEIKAHIKHDIECSPATYGDWERFLKGFKVVGWEFVKAVNTSNGHGQMLKYKVITSFKAPKYENNRAKWEVNIYQTNDIGVYFDGTDYAA